VNDDAYPDRPGFKVSGPSEQTANAIGPRAPCIHMPTARAAVRTFSGRSLHETSPRGVGQKSIAFCQGPALTLHARCHQLSFEKFWTQ
jgi:hypothetical protein